MQPVGLADVLSARDAIQDTAVRTPLIRSQFLSRHAGVEIRLKLENRQPSGAFKLRGAANALAGLPDGVSGVACCSSGNHGRAVAWAARKRGVRAVVFMSSLVPRAKVDRIEELGAEVRVAGSTSNEAQTACTRLATEEGLHEIHPFDDLRVIAGQGTVGIEILEQCSDATTLVIPLSGGGLAGGAALAAKAIRPEIRVVGVSMERGAAMQESLAAGRIVEIEELPSLADALTGDIGLDNRYSFALCRRYLDEVVLVSEEEIYRGIQALHFEDGVAGEGGAAVGVAAILSRRVAGLRGPVVVVITGTHPDPAGHEHILQGADVVLGSTVVKGMPYRTDP